MKNFDPTQHIIFEGYSGSHLYGMNTTESDIDTRGVVLPPLHVLLNPFMNFEIKDSGFDEEDRALYSLAKFFKLCSDANPNIIELLFVPTNLTIYTSDVWENVVNNRDLFLSKNIKHRFLGYAFSQLDAIRRHREWFINPPQEKPAREDFGLSHSPIVSEGNLANALAISQELLRPEVHNELVRERLYRDAKKKWDNFEQWRKNRNPKRKGSEEKFGYDTKYAAHLFRLMEEGKQLLLTGEINFPLHNAEELLAVKNGALSYEEMLKLASTLEDDFDSWYEQSTLPAKPNIEKLEELYFESINIC